jgi:hypothetical protein
MPTTATVRGPGSSSTCPSGEQPSLALVIRVGGSNYWHEVPIQMAP